MVNRAQFGLRGGAYGCWVSKPGIDVLSAAPGDFLVDVGSQVFQCVAKGDTVILTEGQATVPAGTYGTSVALPAQFAQFSNLAMLATYYMLSNGGVYFSDQNISNTYLTFHTTSGVLFLNVTFRANGGTGTPSLSYTHHAAWSVYRGQF